MDCERKARRDRYDRNPQPERDKARRRRGLAKSAAPVSANPDTSQCLDTHTSAKVDHGPGVVKVSPQDFEIDVDESRQVDLPASAPKESLESGEPKNTDREPPKQARLIALLSDIHWPLHEPDLFGAVLDWLDDSNPHEIILTGDFGDWSSVSNYEGDPHRPQFVDDAAHVRWGLKQLRRACPGAVITAMLGNHDGRLEKYIANHVPSLAGAVDLIKAIDVPNVNWIPRGGRVRRGNLKGIHGDQIKSPGMYAAKKLVEVYGEPGIDCFCGHFHRHMVMTKAFDGRRTSTGTLLPTMTVHDHPYLENSEPGWAQGFGEVYVRPDDIAALFVTRYQRGSFVSASGRVYVGRRAA